MDMIMVTTSLKGAARLEDRSYFGPLQTPARLFVLCNLSLTFL